MASEFARLPFSLLNHLRYRRQGRSPYSGQIPAKSGWLRANTHQLAIRNRSRTMKHELTGIGTTLLVPLLLAQSLDAQDVLPLPPPPRGGKVGPAMQHSVHPWREQARHFPAGAPNMLIVMLDDAGFGQAKTFGGQINTASLSRLASQRIAYHAFHTAAMCSPTRAALWSSLHRCADWFQ